MGGVRDTFPTVLHCCYACIRRFPNTCEGYIKYVLSLRSNVLTTRVCTEMSIIPGKEMHMNVTENPTCVLSDKKDCQEVHHSSEVCTTGQGVQQTYASSISISSSASQ